MTRGAGSRRWRVAALETCGSLLLVLILFSLFMVSLHAMFPEGTPLKELVGEEEKLGPARYAGGRQAEATLSSLKRDVRFRRGNSVAWGGASKGMSLFSQDAVQTLDHSGATISFGPSDHLQLGSNSLIVVTRLNAEDEAGPRSYRVQVDGEVRGNLSAGRKLGLELRAAGHLARISSGAARFHVAPMGKDSAGFAVYQGEAQLEGKGRMIRVPANYGVLLRKGVVVDGPAPLPAAPTVGEGRALYRYRLLPPVVRFRWAGPDGDFHFQLARDPHFAKCLIDEKLSSRGTPPGGERGGLTHEFATGKLSQGNYYWRVSRIEEGREGAFSKAGECELVQVLAAPKLSVNFPSGQQAVGLFVLSGTAPAGSKVFVEGVEVEIDGDGGFSQTLSLKPGVNLIRVEAVDGAGNVSYASRIVYGGSQGKIILQ
ncbi:hypothetical protein [Geomonas sp.]|uniref:hypothetical protein n=1 Tax=Geomonas sp. TaxID=2651584 RepID=UPI002B4A8339|nr:hypothetical protein [Geomonas sp.]HJV35242.1 hypothetical protein [Geomonas sp.]